MKKKKEQRDGKGGERNDTRPKEIRDAITESSKVNRNDRQ